jgi:hypothetical protein
MNQRCARLKLLALVIAVFLPLQLDAHSDDGVFTRTLEIEVHPADVPIWEAAVATIAEAIRNIESDVRLHWLVYRSGTAKYFVVVNRFDLDEAVTLENLYAVIRDAPQDSSFKSALTSLQTTNFTVTKDVLWHQHVELSTVPSMSTDSHPLGVVTEYSMKPENRADFDGAMLEYVSFLKRIDYVYPVEGFHWLLGRPGRFMSVTFPDTWVDYYSHEAVDKFVEEKGLSAELLDIRQRLLDTTQSVVETYLTFAPELSP